MCNKAQNHAKPIFTLDLGFFNQPNKGTKPQIQRSVIILGVTKLDKSFSLETQEDEITFKEGLYETFIKDTSLLPQGLAIDDYEIFDLNKFSSGAALVP